MWRPDPGPELTRACAAPDAEDCRTVAETFAASGGKGEACGALFAFSAACSAGDGPSCTALDTRFRNYVLRPDSQPPASRAPAKGRFRAICLFTREGTVRDCTVQENFADDDGAMLSWLLTSARVDPATLDGKPFDCTLPFTVPGTVTPRPPGGG